MGAVEDSNRWNVKARPERSALKNKRQKKDSWVHFEDADIERPSKTSTSHVLPGRGISLGHVSSSALLELSQEWEYGLPSGVTSVNSTSTSRSSTEADEH